MKRLKKLILPVITGIIGAMAVAVAAPPTTITYILASMVQGLAPSALTDTTNAGNISTGVLASARLPAAASSAQGAVATGTPVTNGFLTSFLGGVAQYSTAAFSQLTGAATATQMPSTLINTFTGDGSTTAFTLSGPPVSLNKVSANIGGVLQQHSVMSLSGAVVTFVSAPPNNTPIEIDVNP